MFDTSTIVGLCNVKLIPWPVWFVREYHDQWHVVHPFAVCCSEKSLPRYNLSALCLYGRGPSCWETFSPNLLAVVALTTVASFWAESWLVLFVVLKRDSKKVYKLFVSKVQQQQQQRRYSPSDWPSVLKWFLWLFTSPHCDVNSN